MVGYKHEKSMTEIRDLLLSDEELYDAWATNIESTLKELLKDVWS